MLTSALRWAFLVSPNCLLGLIARITIPASMAMAATTNKISSKVKPLQFFRNFLVIIFSFELILNKIKSGNKNN